MSEKAATGELIVHSREPLNAEPLLDKLGSSFVTHVDDFYVRCHGEIPQVDHDAYRLTVGGHVAEPLTLSLDDLARRFERVEVAATLQCAGNRRAELDAAAPVTGDPWAPGAIGTATWGGVRLLDILIEAGIEEESARHVAFRALDTAETDDGTAAFETSIPVDKAYGGEVILATEMNGSPLRPVHGAPLRLIVPGYAGVRSVKWLSAIEVRTEPSQAFHQQKDYKLFPPDMTPESVDYARGATIYEMPVNSAICVPADNGEVAAGRVALSGWAIAGERQVSRVDVSPDGGRSWIQAELDEREPSPWTWTLWHAELALTPGVHEIAVRAVDSAGQHQPPNADDVWNFKGYLSAAWHRIQVTAK